MKCKIEGCERDAMYQAQCVCQKHYFRFMRYGTYDLSAPIKRKMRISNPAGYQKLYEPEHPLAGHDGYVYEHRKVVFDKYHRVLPDCEICGKPTNWETCHIDHKDNDVTNNNHENLRPLCNACNTRRFYPEQHTIKGRRSVTFEGVTKTPQEWSRDERVNVCGAQIALRMMSGMSDYDALFSPKKTHNGKNRKRD